MTQKIQRRFALHLAHNFDHVGWIKYEGPRLAGVPHARVNEFMQSVLRAWENTGLVGFSLSKWPSWDCAAYTIFEIYEDQPTEDVVWLWGLVRFPGAPDSVCVCSLQDTRLMRSQKMPHQNFRDRHFKAIEELLRVWEQFIVD